MSDRVEERSSRAQPIVYSVEEAADMLGISRTFMFQLIGKGAIQSFKLGKHRKISREALDTFIAQLLREQTTK
jgi:excisionase family DNA binding protein